MRRRTFACLLSLTAFVAGCADSAPVGVPYFIDQTGGAEPDV
jgi:hypothetical protein